MGNIIANINQIYSAAADLEKAASIISEQKAILDQVADDVDSGWKSTETSRFIQCTERSKASMTMIAMAVQGTAGAMRVFAFNLAAADAQNDAIANGVNVVQETVTNAVSKKSASTASSKKVSTSKKNTTSSKKSTKKKGK